MSGPDSHPVLARASLAVAALAVCFLCALAWAAHARRSSQQISKGDDKSFEATSDDTLLTAPVVATGTSSGTHVRAEPTEQPTSDLPPSPPPDATPFEVRTRVPYWSLIEKLAKVPEWKEFYNRAKWRANSNPDYVLYRIAWLQQLTVTQVETAKRLLASEEQETTRLVLAEYGALSAFEVDWDQNQVECGVRVKAVRDRVRRANDQAWEDALGSESMKIVNEHLRGDPIVVWKGADLKIGGAGRQTWRSDE